MVQVHVMDLHGTGIAPDAYWMERKHETGWSGMLFGSSNSSELKSKTLSNPNLHYCPLLQIALTLRRKSRIDPWGINRPEKCAVIPVGRPQVHANSTPSVRAQ